MEAGKVKILILHDKDQRDLGRFAKIRAYQGMAAMAAGPANQQNIEINTVHLDDVGNGPIRSIKLENNDLIITDLSGLRAGSGNTPEHTKFFDMLPDLERMNPDVFPPVVANPPRRVLMFSGAFPNDAVKGTDSALIEADNAGNMEIPAGYEQFIESGVDNKGPSRIRAEVEEIIAARFPGTTATPNQPPVQGPAAQGTASPGNP